LLTPDGVHTFACAIPDYDFAFTHPDDGSFDTMVDVEPSADRLHVRQIRPHDKGPAIRVRDVIDDSPSILVDRALLRSECQLDPAVSGHGESGAFE
jgi:hypothetical protein